MPGADGRDDGGSSGDDPPPGGGGRGDGSGGGGAGGDAGDGSGDPGNDDGQVGDDGGTGDDQQDGYDYEYHDHHDYYDYDFWYVCGWWGWFTWGYLWCDDLYYPWVWYYRTRYGQVVYLHYPFFYNDYDRIYYVDESEVYPPLPSDSYLDPDWTMEELLRSGRDLFLGGDYLGAAEAFRQAILLDVEDPLPKFAYAQALFALGNYPFASLAIRLGLKLLPDWPMIGGDVRDFYADEEEYTAHMEALAYYLEERPDDAAALLVWGYMSYFTGAIDEANQAFTEILARFPNDPAARTFSEAIGAMMARQSAAQPAQSEQESGGG